MDNHNEKEWRQRLTPKQDHIDKSAITSKARLRTFRGAFLIPPAVGGR
jgi:hypothetical protein